MFGSNHLYVFQHPALYKSNPKNYSQVITYEMAQGEIAAQSGFDMSAKQSNGKFELCVSIQSRTSLTLRITVRLLHMRWHKEK